MAKPEIASRIVAEHDQHLRSKLDRGDLTFQLITHPLTIEAKQSGEVAFDWVDDEGRAGSERQTILVSA